MAKIPFPHDHFDNPSARQAPELSADRQTQTSREAPKPNQPPFTKSENMMSKMFCTLCGASPGSHIGPCPGARRSQGLGATYHISLGTHNWYQTDYEKVFCIKCGAIAGAYHAECSGVGTSFHEWQGIK